MPRHRKKHAGTMKKRTHKKRKSTYKYDPVAQWLDMYSSGYSSSRSSQYEYHPSTSVMEVGARTETEAFIKRPLTVQVVRLGPYIPRGTTKVRCRCVFGDGMALIRGFCFQQPTFRVGDTLTLRDYKYEDGYVIMHSRTEYSRAGYRIHVPRHVLELADSYMCTPVQLPCRISELRPNRRVSFYGWITEVEEIRQIEHGVAVRDVHCEDGSGETVLAMWRYCADVQFQVGQTILVIDGRAKASTYHDMVSVSINHPDEVQIIKQER